MLVTLAGVLGASGALLAVANAEPELAIRAFAGNADAQRRLLTPHQRATARFPHGIKELAAERYGTSTTTRIG